MEWHRRVISGVQFLKKFKDLPIEDIDIHTNTQALTFKALAYHSVREDGGFEKDGGFLLPADLDFITGCQACGAFSIYRVTGINGGGGDNLQPLLCENTAI